MSHPSWTLANPPNAYILLTDFSKIFNQLLRVEMFTMEVSG